MLEFFKNLGKFVGLGTKFVPYVNYAINAIEIVSDLIKGFKGQAKEDAVIAAVTRGLPILEGALEKDVVNDAAVIEATRQYIRAYVALQNAIRATLAARQPS
jgi:hypothetical protein